MIRHRTLVSRMMAGLVLTACCLFAAPAPAQDLVAQVPSLKWIPADAGTYNAMLRNREQLEIILKSKAVAKIMAMPSVKMLKQQFDKEWANPDGPFAQVSGWLAQPANAQLVEIVKDLVSDEIFTYTDKNTAEFGALFQEVYSSGRFAPLIQLMKEGPEGLNRDPAFQYKIMLQTLNDNADRLKFPDVVTGFKITRTKPAQLAKMIDSALEAAAQFVPPQYQKAVKKVKIHGSDVHTIVLDGSMVPWELVPWAMVEDVPGQYAKLQKKLKQMKITFAVGVRDNYLLYSLGEGTAGLKALGAPGKKLIDRPEFAPLVKFGDRKMVAISYVSKESLSYGSELNVDETAKWVDSLLKESTLSPAQQTKIKKDFRALMADAKKYIPEIGALVHFDFLTKRGYESYNYNWSKNPTIDGTKPLTILEHVGGQPIGFMVERSPSQVEGYKDFVKYVKLAHDYLEEYAVPKMPKAELGKYRKFMKQALPLFARLDKATAQKLLPSMDGQGGWVLDFKLKLKLPKIKNAMPVPEFGIVTGLSDAPLFLEAMTEYRNVFNSLVDVAVKFAPPGEEIPNFKIPAAKVKKVLVTKKSPGVTLYTWPLPSLPELDPKLVPTAGLSDKMAVFAISQEHATRLLKKSVFKADGGPLGNTKKPLAGAAHFNWAGLLDAVTPWVDFGLAESRQGQDTIDQVHTVMSVLKCFRGFTSATYLEDGAVVTHGESIFRDLEK